MSPFAGRRSDRELSKEKRIKRRDMPSGCCLLLKLNMEAFNVKRRFVRWIFFSSVFCSQGDACGKLLLLHVLRITCIVWRFSVWGQKIHIVEGSYRVVSESICLGLEINHKRSLCCLKKHLNIQFTICFSLRRYVTYIYNIQFLSDAYFTYIRTRYSPTHHVFHKYTAIVKCWSPTIHSPKINLSSQ